MQSKKVKKVKNDASLINQLYRTKIIIMDKQGLQNLPAPKYTRLFTEQELGLLQYSHLAQENEFDFVYKPNDDTFLILSTLKHEIPQLSQTMSLCQIGSGSGIISANLHRWLMASDKQPLLHISIDLNMDASLLSKRYYDHYQLNIQQINTSSFKNLKFGESYSSIRPQVIVFNPPYVPVEQEEIQNEQKYLVQKLKFIREERKCIRTREQNLIAYSYMGGLDGLAITRKILRQISWQCTVYFIVMGAQGLLSIKKELESGQVVNAKAKLKSFQLLQYGHFQNEHLFVVKALLVYKS